MDRNATQRLLALTLAASGFGAGCSSSDSRSATAQAGSRAAGGSPGPGGGGPSSAGSAGAGALAGTPAVAGKARTNGGSGAAAASGGFAGIEGLGGTSGARAPGQAGSDSGGAGASGGAPPGVPAGYPEPRAANWQKCKTVAQVSDRSGMLCPGGGLGPVCYECLSGATLGDQSSLHSADTQAVANAQSVPYIDLTKITTDWYNGTVGASGWQAYHAVGAGGGSDKTHTKIKGAVAIAGFIATAIQTQNIGLAKYLR